MDELIPPARGAAPAQIARRSWCHGTPARPGNGRAAAHRGKRRPTHRQSGAIPAKAAPPGPGARWHDIADTRPAGRPAARRAELRGGCHAPIRVCPPAGPGTALTHRRRRQPRPRASRVGTAGRSGHDGSTVRFLPDMAAAAGVAVGHHPGRPRRAPPGAGLARPAWQACGPAVASPPGTSQAGERELMTVRTLGWFQASGLPVRAAHGPPVRAFPASRSRAPLTRIVDVQAVGRAGGSKRL